MKTKMQDLQLTPLAPRYQEALDKINYKNKKKETKKEKEKKK